MSRFIDEVEIIVRSGDGGSGAVSFRREKYVPRGGPDGGDGGDGGNIVFKTQRKVRSLYDIMLRQTFKAGKGHAGSGKKRKGAKGEDCIITVPLGTVIMEKESRRTFADLKVHGEEMVLLKGGKGGLGNARFATSTNRAPRYAQKGERGKALTLILQIKTIADMGIVGLPNAGKSTLLSTLTNAHPKVGDYPFTTLSPNIGVMNYRGIKQFIIADVPGIIEGASRGTGLGIRFLKHVERTRGLIVLIDLAAGEFHRQYETLVREMTDYSERLPEKQRLVVGSKQDIASDDQIDHFLSMGIPEDRICVSSVTGSGIETLKDKIALFLENMHGNTVS